MSFHRRTMIFHTPADAPMRNTSSQKKPAKNQHASVREDHATELAQDYVEAIDDLIREDGTCRLIEIARRFAVSHVTANRTLARLKRDGLVESQPYGPITLTADGRRMAQAARRRHKIVLDFLIALGVDDQTATSDAEGMEHHVSKKTLAAMARYLRNQLGAGKIPS
jgi:DtxR family manganese transport transcriptional regulator